MKLCEICQEPFEPRNNRQRVCSPACGRMYWLRYNRDKMREKRGSFRPAHCVDCGAVIVRDRNKKYCANCAKQRTLALKREYEAREEQKIRSNELRRTRRKTNPDVAKAQDAKKLEKIKSDPFLAEKVRAAHRAAHRRRMENPEYAEKMRKQRAEYNQKNAENMRAYNRKYAATKRLEKQMSALLATPGGDKTDE